MLCCPGVDDSTLLKINEYLFEPPLVQVMQQQDLVLNEVNDLLRYKEGELLTFLLKLSPEQEKYASWSLNTTGPALVKGGPGTGKSTVALYRIRSLLSQLHKTGKGVPHILFTTYTNALIKSSQQLLQQLLGPDARYIKVDTADRVAYSVLNSCGHAQDYAILDDHEELTRLTAQFFRKASRNFRFTLSSCAILCPSENTGKALEAALKEQSIEATFMTGQELNLARSGVKIITLKSSKGLEFPIVALAGFTSGGYLMLAQDAAPEKFAETLEREAIFVDTSGGSIFHRSSGVG